MATTDGTSAGRSANSQPIPETAFWNGPPQKMPEQLGRYRIKQRLGGGGMGAVYLVENTELQRDEALKTPHFEIGGDPAVRERFLREARAAAKLEHPNLCPIYHADAIDGVYFLTMRYLKGKPLSAYSGRAHPPRGAIAIIVKLAKALEYAHGQGVIHRDLKPSNVMMCPGVGPVVLDFGLAKQIALPDHKLTQTGTTLGTPAYMPPEQVKGDLTQMGLASDVYSLGVILFELLTGHLPFTGTMGEIMGKVLYAEAPLPSQLLPGLDSALDRVCDKAMAKEPENRYPSMKAFAAALGDLLRTMPAAEEAPEPKPASGSKQPTPAAMLDPLCFQTPTALPGQAPEPSHPPPSKRPPIPPIPPAPRRDAADETKKKPIRKQPVADARPAPKRGSSVVKWLCITLVLALGSVVVVFLLLSGPKKVKQADNNEVTGAEAAAGWKKEITNSIGMELMHIPAGTFKMGSPVGEEGRGTDEEQHEVEITKAFWLGVHEVTQKQFKDVMGYNPSYFSKDGAGGPGLEYKYGKPAEGKVDADTSNFPVENVSHDEAVEFCKKLSEKEAKSERKYRLPTEAEWEYSCRGGAPSYQAITGK